MFIIIIIIGLFGVFYRYNPLLVLTPSAFCSVFQSSLRKFLKCVLFSQMVVIPFRLLAISIFMLLTGYDFLLSLSYRLPV